MNAELSAPGNVDSEYLPAVSALAASSWLDSLSLCVWRVSAPAKLMTGRKVGRQA